MSADFLSSTSSGTPSHRPLDSNDRAQMVLEIRGAMNDVIGELDLITNDEVRQVDERRRARKEAAGLRDSLGYFRAGIRGDVDQSIVPGPAMTAEGDLYAFWEQLETRRAELARKRAQQEAGH